MKKVLKKSLAFILALTMALGAAPLAGLVGLEMPEIGEIFAEKAEAATYGVLSYEITDREVTITDCDKLASGELVIPDKIEGYPVTSIGNYAFSNCTSLTSIIMPDSVTSIGQSAFKHCDSLTSVTIPVGTKRIDYSAFRNCTNLTSISIPDSDMQIEYGAFNDTGIYNDESNWENGVLYIGNHLIEAKDTVSGNYVIKSGTKTIAAEAFVNCKSLTSITIPAGVIRISYFAFSCTSLTSISIPDSVMYIENGAFDDTVILNDESNWENGVLYIGNHLIKAKETVSGNYSIKPGTKTIADAAFSWCENLTNITIPDSVTSIGYDAFEYCKNLTSVTISANVTNIGDEAFGDCTGLESITVDEKNQYYSSDEHGVLFNKYKTKLIKYPAGNKRIAYTICDGITMIGDNAFDESKNLISITIPDSVISIGNWTFSYCTSLKSISIPAGVMNIGDTVFYDCESLANITIPDSVTSIGRNAFDECTGLTDVYYSGTEAQWNAIDIADFNTCLTHATIHFNFTGTPLPFTYEISNGEVTITDCDTSAIGALEIPATIEGYPVTSIGHHTFSACENLTKITIPNSVRSIGNFAFYYCASLTSVSIPDSVTSIGESAFFRCGSLTSITIPDSVTSIGAQTFCYCTSLTSITVPKSVTSIGNFAFYYCTSLKSISIPGGVTSISEGAFCNCESLKSISIPNGVKSIGDMAFSSCVNLTNVTIPVGVVSIGEYAFSNCTSLTTITIPDGVTNIKYGAFSNCTNLTSISIPDSVTSIGRYAFNNCNSLKTVYYTGSPESWKAISIDDGNEPLLNAEIIYGSSGSEGGGEDPVITPVIAIRTPSRTAINYGDSIILHLDIEKPLPDGAYIEWSESNGNFDMSVSSDGLTCKISPKSNGKTVFTATIYDKDGKVISIDTQEMTAKAGLWQKIVAFFKKIFGLTKTIPEAFKGIF